MRITTLLLLLALAVGTQIAPAQSQPDANAQPAPAAVPDGSIQYPGSAQQDQFGSQVDPADSIAAPAVQPAVPAPATTKEVKPAEPDRQAVPPDMLPDANKKSPYWEPRDWDYIYEQGG
jgi:hypothetical protein